MKKMLCLLLAVLLLASVGAPVLAEGTGEDEIDYTTGTPWRETSPPTHPPT